MDHIFRTKNHIANEMYFCLKGYEDFIDELGHARINNHESKHIVAKCVQSKRPKHLNSHGQHYRYYIKISAKHEAYNPIQYFKFENNTKDLVNQVCKNEWVFKEVNKTIFDKYIQFLNTKNIAWLREVERDIN